MHYSRQGRIIQFIKILSQLIKWDYKEANWNWNGFNLYKFTKKDFTGQNKSLNNKTFNEFLNLNPLSWAMTSGINVEYTIEEPDKMV